MKKLSNYIQEKLIINKDTDIQFSFDNVDYLISLSFRAYTDITRGSSDGFGLFVNIIRDVTIENIENNKCRLMNGICVSQDRAKYHGLEVKKNNDYGVLYINMHDSSVSDSVILFLHPYYIKKFNNLLNLTNSLNNLIYAKSIFKILELPNIFLPVSFRYVSYLLMSRDQSLDNIKTYIKDKLLHNQISEKLIINKEFNNFYDWSTINRAFVFTFTKEKSLYIDLIKFNRFKKTGNNKYNLKGSSYINDDSSYEGKYNITDGGKFLYTIDDYGSKKSFFCVLMVHFEFKEEYVKLLNSLMYKSTYNIDYITKTLGISINDIQFFDDNKEFKMERTNDDIELIKNFLSNL